MLDAMTSETQSRVSLSILMHPVENAKIFKEEFLKRNVKIQQGLLNLQSMRLGINSVVALSNSQSLKKVRVILIELVGGQDQLG
jgi:hypothetical protein